MKRLVLRNKPPPNAKLAAELVEAGLTIFPAADKNKPLVNWGEGSSKDVEQVREWWQRWPHAVPCINCGKSALLVVDPDIDPENPSIDGPKAFARLCATHKWEPDGVPTVVTPRGGRHHYFGMPNEMLGNGEGSLPKGINVRGRGGYVVA